MIHKRCIRIVDTMDKSKLIASVRRKYVENRAASSAKIPHIGSFSLALTFMKMVISRTC